MLRRAWPHALLVAESATGLLFAISVALEASSVTGEWLWLVAAGGAGFAFSAVGEQVRLRREIRLLRGGDLIGRLTHMAREGEALYQAIGASVWFTGDSEQERQWNAEKQAHWSRMQAWERGCEALLDERLSTFRADWDASTTKERPGVLREIVRELRGRAKDTSQ